MTASQNYDSNELGTLTHQLCLQHVQRDLKAAAELYPDQTWPVQLAGEIRALIHQANQARPRGLKALPATALRIPLRGLRAAVAMGLHHTKDLGDTRPGARKSRLLLEEFTQREEDFLRFTTGLHVMPEIATPRDHGERLHVNLSQFHRIGRGVPVTKRRVHGNQTGQTEGSGHREALPSRARR